MIIGLTGGIGSGKSEVSCRFEKLGITVVDADTIAYQVVEPDSPALETIANHFGRHILNENGRLNRTQLRNIIFEDPSQKKWVESLLHPLIRTITIDQLNHSTSSYTILSSPLLLETTQHELVTRVLVVDTSEEVQLIRAMSRDASSSEHIKKIMNAQVNRNERCAKADDIIYNNGDLTELDSQVKRLHDFYCELAKN